MVLLSVMKQILQVNRAIADKISCRITMITKIKVFSVNPQKLTNAKW